jgi:hypothetical protein
MGVVESTPRPWGWSGCPQNPFFFFFLFFGPFGGGSTTPRPAVRGSRSHPQGLGGGLTTPKRPKPFSLSLSLSLFFFFFGYWGWLQPPPGPGHPQKAKTFFFFFFWALGGSWTIPLANHPQTEATSEFLHSFFKKYIFFPFSFFF